MIRVWRDRLVEKWDEIHEKTRAQWLALNDREKRILTILGGLVVVLIFALVIKETSSLFKQVASQSDSNVRNIEKIQTALQEIQSQRFDLMRYERLKSKRSDDFDFQQFVDMEAKKFGITIAKSAPARVVGDDEESKNEEWLDVELKDASLDSLVKLFASIEDTLGLKLIQISIKTQFQDQTKLDASVTISNKKNL